MVKVKNNISRNCRKISVKKNQLIDLLPTYIDVFLNPRLFIYSNMVKYRGPVSDVQYKNLIFLDTVYLNKK